VSPAKHKVAVEGGSEVSWFHVTRSENSFISLNEETNVAHKCILAPGPSDLYNLFAIVLLVTRKSNP